MKINGKTVLVTGANRGMGLAFSKELNKRGAIVYLGMRKTEEFNLEGFSNPERVKIIALDLGSKESIEQFIASNKDLDIDILINNAGVLTGGLLEEQKLDEVYEMFQVNLVGLIHLTRYFIPKMISKGTGKIVNNSSVSSIMHFACASTYAASKAGLYAFTNCLNSELKGTGVTTLTLITPGIQTDMFSKIDHLYGKHLDMSALKSISADQYAIEVCRSIETDAEYFKPKGKEGVGLFLARHLPSLFKIIANNGFKRSIKKS